MEDEQSPISMTSLLILYFTNVELLTRQTSLCSAAPIAVNFAYTFFEAPFVTFGCYDFSANHNLLIDHVVFHSTQDLCKVLTYLGHIVMENFRTYLLSLLHHQFAVHITN